MSDLRDLPDLAGDVRERVVTPPYDAVSRRVLHRRLRGAAGSVAAAVLVVGGIAVWQNAATTAGPSVPQPATTQGPIPPTDESQWRAVVNGTNAGPFEVSGTDDGSVAIVWRALEHPEPTFALVIREADGSVHGRRLDVPVTLTPVPGGWVGLETTRGWLIASDGSWTDLGAALEPRAPEAGDVAVVGQFGRWLYRPDERSWSTLSFDVPVDGAYLAPDGTTVTCARVGDDRIHVRSGVSRLQLMAVANGDACLVTGSGDTVSVLAIGDAANGDLPLRDALRSTDGGRTWARPTFEDLGSITSQAVGADGTVVVTGTDGRSFVVHPDGGYSEPTVALGVVFAAGDRFYATSYGQDKGLLLTSRYHGATWQETRLPGME